MRIGLISDTHGLLRAEALEYLAGSDFIIHAGDIVRDDTGRAAENCAGHGGARQQR
jgi:predicted phosphodiesterase